MAARPLVSYQGHLLKYPQQPHMTGDCLAQIICEQASTNKRNPSEHGCRGISEKDGGSYYVDCCGRPKKNR